MTLGGRMAINLAALTVTVAALGAGTIVGLRNLHQRVFVNMRAERAAWIEIYRTYVVDVGAPILMAGQALQQQPIDVRTARQQLRAAALGLSRIELPDGAPQEVRDAFEQSRLTLRRAENRLRGPTGRSGEIDPDDASALRRELDDVRAVAAHLTGQIRASYDAIDRAMARQMRNMTWAIAGLAGLVVLGAIGISVWQYRSVMRPIRRVTAGVRRVAAGRFDERVDAGGHDELGALARDFNAMAEQLDALYRDLEQRVRTTSRELVRAERLASVGYLAAGVAHEINNPLGIIAGRAELALRKLGDSDADAADRRALEIICDEAFRCKNITEKLLSLSRGSDESREPVDLGDVAREVVEMVEQLPRFADRRVTVDVGAGPLVVHASAAQMKQVLLNLAINALEAAPAETGRARIDVRRKADRVVLRVEDNGRGMDADTLGRVFEPFFTAQRGAAEDEAGARAPGTGLGLSICHAIVTDHGGTIRAESEGAGRGSTFIIELPATNATDERTTDHAS